MERKNHTLVPYTTGSLEQPTPRVVSMLRNSPYAGRTEGVNLKQDIVSTLNFINTERSYWQKMQLASMKLARTMSQASLEEVTKLHHRWQEVSVLCQIQRIKRESLKYNSELQRTFQHGTVDNLNIKRKIVRPEHFERGTPHSLPANKTTKAPLVKQATKTASKNALVNRNKGITSPWEGSQFKFELLCSLRAKLLKKLILSALRAYKQAQQNNRQCITTCIRGRMKRLVQLCFSALLLEALSAKYIVFAANFTTRKLILHKYLRPAVGMLQQHLHRQHHYAALYTKSSALYRRHMRRQGYRLLIWHKAYMVHSRVCVKWAHKHAQQQHTVRAFAAWIGCFVEKNRLRQQIYTRYNTNKPATGTSHLSSTLNTPNNRHTTTHNHTTNTHNTAYTTSDTPLKRVLEQSPLQNLRTAVSFFIEQHSTKNSSTRITTNTNTHNRNNTTNNHNNTTPHNSTIYTTYTSSEDENTNINDTDVPHSCQKSINTSFRRSITELKSTLQGINSATIMDGDSDISVDSIVLTNNNTHHTTTNKHKSPHTTKHSTTSHNTNNTTQPMLQSNMRDLFRSCIKAKQAFPQHRFDNTAFDVASSDSSSGGGTGCSVYIQGVYSASSSPTSIRNTNTTNTSTSSKWRNRHNNSSNYINTTHGSGTDSSGEYNNIEDLLLNNTTTPLSTSSRRSRSHKHNTSHTNTSINNSTIHTGGLMDRAIHESFILSPAKPHTPHTTYTTNNTNTNTTNNTTPYFTHPTTTGTFCGQVEVDSDIESAFSESTKHTHLHHYNSSSGASGNGVNGVSNRRLVLQRRFVTQIQGAFQMIKFRWLIQQCRRFVRTLHRTSRMHSLAHRCRRLSLLHSRRHYLERWRGVYAKHAQTSDLCVQIHHIKLCRKLLRAWFAVSINRLVPAYTHTYRLAHTTALRRSMHVWRALYVQRMYQHTIDRSMASSKKVRIFAHWRVYVSMVKRSRHIHSVMAKKVLSPVFRQWRTKYKQRLLLSRVFTLHAAAWDHRTYTAPSPFQRLHAVLTAWKEHTGRCLRIRHAEANQRRSLTFRGVSLLARHFHCWLDYRTSSLREKRQSAARRAQIKSTYFALWAQRCGQQKRQMVLLRRRLLEQSPMRRVLHFWHHYTAVRSKYAPFVHYNAVQLRKAFGHLKTMRPVRRLQERGTQLEHTSKLRISLLAWRGLLSRTQDYRRGLFLLNRAFLRLKMKLAYLCWPGRRQSLLARQMQEYLSLKHRDRILLVEQCVVEEKTPEVTSFVAKRRPTLAQRASKLRFIDHIADVKGLHYYKTLCTAILQLWSVAAKTDVSLRYRAFQVKHALQTRTLRERTMQWVLLTPKTAYRRVVWMLKSAHKPHDDYCHRKEQHRVYETAARQRRKSEPRKHNNVKSVGFTIPAGAKGGLNITSTSSVGGLNTCSVDSEEGAKYDGEYYIDSDDSDADNTPHHQVVWR